ncbi:MAG: hypothetical protein ACREUA_04590 [Burkholderiales bacterium]
MPADADVLIFVEDPGAVHYIAALPAALEDRGRKIVVLSAGIATEYLEQRGIRHKKLTASAAPGQILRNINPRLLLVGTASNPDTAGLKLIAAARSARIPSVGVVDAAMNSGFRFRGRSDNPLAYAPDWILVPDEVTRNSFLELGARSERVLALGHPHYDFVIGLAETWRHKPHAHFRKQVFPDVPTDRAIVVFVSEGSARITPISKKDLAEFTLHGRSGTNGRTEIVLEELIEALASVTLKPYVVLRIHPRDDETDFAAYSGTIDKISKDEPALEVVYAANLVVGMTSMLLTEAALLGCAVLPIIPRKAEIEWLPLTRSGALTAATTQTAIAKRLRELLSNTKGREQAERLRQAYPKGSTDQIAGFLHGIIGTRNTG